MNSIQHQFISVSMTIVILTVLIVILTVLIVKVDQDFGNHESKMTRYLNFNSTHLNGGFNPSDVGYEEVIDTLEYENYIKDFIKNYVNASESSRVIFNSGSTESIATVINWSKQCNKYGFVLGSKLDHPNVRSNCENMNVDYVQLNSFNPLSTNSNDKSTSDSSDNSIIGCLLGGSDQSDNCSMIFITHVCGSTGEVYPFDSLDSILEHYHQSHSHPLIIADVSQSIGKIPINMKENHINGLFFSLHKIGGDYNSGVLVIDDTIDKPFHPLISGNQQDGLRGGTYDTYSYQSLPKLLEEYSLEYDHDKCRLTWFKSVDYLRRHLKNNPHVEVIEPKLNHLFNTILIKVDHCCLEIINRLSQRGIYVSASTSCQSSKDHFIRISFLDGSELNEETLKSIVDEINNDSKQDSKQDSKSTHQKV